jgi:hypothetical protein
VNGHGRIPVAVLGSAGLDVTHIDVSSVKFGGLDVAVKGKEKIQCSYEDVSGDFAFAGGVPDGYLDLVCHFADDAAAWSPSDGTATLTGSLLPEFGGSLIEGTDEICIRPPE